MMKFDTVAIAVLVLLANPVVAQVLTVTTTAYCGRKGVKGCPGIDPLNAPAGKKVTICYEVKNTGTRALTRVNIFDIANPPPIDIRGIGIGTLMPGQTYTWTQEDTSPVMRNVSVYGRDGQTRVQASDPYTVKDAGKPYSAGCDGDPHFKTWGGHHYDYHGECDLVLLHNADFESGMGIDVHIRTKIRRDMSYISSAALRIGKDVLEVESQGVYWLNGVLNADLPDEFSGFAFSHTQPTDKQHVFEVSLGGSESIKLNTYKDFVSVLVEQGTSEHFHHSTGLMGDFTMGHMIARDGQTVIDDANAFGQEWQVLNTEPSLFQTVRFPQYPNVCTMPTPVQANQLRRRLAETSLVDEAAAEKACEHWGEGKDDCVFDVLTTGDLEMAVVGAY
jgi:hypothetical protein